MSMCYLILVHRAHRELIQEVACLRHRTIGVVGREHYPVGSYLKIQVEERRSKIETAERIVNIFSEVVCNRMIKLRYVWR